MNIRKQTRVRYFDDDDAGQEYVFEPIEDTVIKEKTADGYKLKYLIQDEQPTAPNEDGDGTIFLVHYHRDFWIEHEAIQKEVLGDWYRGKQPEELQDYHVFAVATLIHSGIWLSLSNSFMADSGGWDTSHVGAICVKKTEFGSGGVQFEHTRDEAETMAASLLKAWNQYLSGDVYCCVAEQFDKEKQHIDYEVVCGFYGLDYANDCLQNEF